MTRMTTRLIWSNADYTIRISLNEQEEYKEQYPGGNKYWYNIPGTMRFVVETDTATTEFENAMAAFQYANTLV